MKVKTISQNLQEAAKEIILKKFITLMPIPEKKKDPKSIT